MTVLNPIWFWGLVGLAIPVGIHLLSRKEGKTIRLGSIRFLTETSTSKFSSIRLNEVVLLAVRSLLIGLIVLFLAGLFVSSSNDKNSVKWVLVEEELENNPRVLNLLDSLQKNGYEIRRLTESFPLLQKNDTATQKPDYYKLSEELFLKNNVHAIVLTSNSLTNFKGKRISLPENITWLSFPDVSEASAAETFTQKDSLKISVIYDKEFRYDKNILLAALYAIKSSAPKKLIISEAEADFVKSGDTDWVIWLSEKEPVVVKKIIRFKNQFTRDLLVQENKANWILTKRLDKQIAVEQHLPIQLIQLLFDYEIKEQINKSDNRTIADKLAWRNNSEAHNRRTVEAGQSADEILILIIALLFIAERIFAFYRRQ
jgi:hypothetical protein